MNPYDAPHQESSQAVESSPATAFPARRLFLTSLVVLVTFSLVLGVSHVWSGGAALQAFSTGDMLATVVAVSSARVEAANVATLAIWTAYVAVVSTRPSNATLAISALAPLPASLLVFLLATSVATLLMSALFGVGPGESLSFMASHLKLVDFAVGAVRALAFGAVLSLLLVFGLVPLRQRQVRLLPRIALGWLFLIAALLPIHVAFNVVLTDP